MKLTKDQYYSEFRDPLDSCQMCSNIIWYPHTLIINKKDRLEFINSTFLTTKNIGDTNYTLTVCYECLCKEYPETAHKNSSKLFNTCNKYVKFAFNVSDSDFSLQKKKHGITVEKMISKYGENEGLKRWKEYCEMQKITNTFTYKKEKLGWDDVEFKKFNKSRAITKENLISKYGEKDGLEKWEKYINRQKYTKSLEYLISIHGKDEGTLKYSKINKSKALTLDNYIAKHGLEEGLTLFKQRVLKKDSFFSKISQSFFEQLDLEIKDLNLSTYYHSKNGEFGKILKSLGKYCKLDFFIKELNLTIEYYGDYWHANPNLYSKESILFANKKAEEIWKEDSNRITALLTEHNIETVVVWQTEDNKNRHSKIKEISNEIRSKIRKNKEH